MRSETYMESIISKIAIMLVPALLAVMLHEVSHGYIAERFGDPTARLLGRLTLNPFKHIDPIGTIAVFIFGFGWARPVPVNPGNFRHPKRDMIWVAVAGPVTNLLLAIASAFLLRCLGYIDQSFVGAADMYSKFSTPVKMMLGFSLYINTLLGVFNLIPLPPLDGGRVLTRILSNAGGTHRPARAFRFCADFVAGVFHRPMACDSKANYPYVGDADGGQPG